jgi:hypothetical protein
MAEKNLPIKFFQKRQKDEQDTEGGGERKIPAGPVRSRSVRSPVIFKVSLLKYLKALPLKQAVVIMCHRL